MCEWMHSFSSYIVIIKKFLQGMRPRRYPRGFREGENRHTVQRLGGPKLAFSGFYMRSAPRTVPRGSRWEIAFGKKLYTEWGLGDSPCGTRVLLFTPASRHI